MRGSPTGFRFSDEYRTVAESRIVEMLLLAGWAYEQDEPKAIATTHQALDRWIEMGLGLQLGAAGERLFDPVEVLNFLKRLGVEGRDSFWADRYVRTGRRLVSDLASRAKRPFMVDLRRTFSLRKVPVGKSLRLRVPLPLAGVHGESLEIAPFIEGSPDAHLNISDGRLEARLVANGNGPVTLGAKLSFLGAASSVRHEGLLDRASYLKRREGLIVVTDRVIALAHKLVGAGTDPETTACAFWNFMLDDLMCGAIHYDQLCPDAPCDSVIENGWYDCQLGSALFAGLCRARGIPARLAGGHVLYRRAPTNHYWAEAWFEETGWTPFDFLSWDLSLGGCDARWRDHFYRKIDDRMVTQLMPFNFTGALGVAMPDAWHILQTAKGDGIEICLAALDGESVYSDALSISD